MASEVTPGTRATPRFPRGWRSGEAIRSSFWEARAHTHSALEREASASPL